MNPENQTAEARTNTQLIQPSSFKEKPSKTETWVMNYTQLLHGKQQAASKSKNTLSTLSPVFIFPTFHPSCCMSFSKKNCFQKKKKKQWYLLRQPGLQQPKRNDHVQVRHSHHMTY